MIQFTTWVGGAAVKTAPFLPFHPDYVKRLILATGGHPFRVSFVRRSGGGIRHMVAIIGEPKEDSKPAYDFNAHKLLPVMDLENNGWRSIPLDGVFSFQFSIPGDFGL